MTSSRIHDYSSRMIFHAQLILSNSFVEYFQFWMVVVHFQTFMYLIDFVTWSHATLRVHRQIRAKLHDYKVTYWWKINKLIIDEHTVTELMVFHVFVISSLIQFCDIISTKLYDWWTLFSRFAQEKGFRFDRDQSWENRCPPSSSRGRKRRWLVNKKNT